MPYQVFDVAVPGGAIRVGRWGRGPQVVIAAHGLTATHGMPLDLSGLAGLDVEQVVRAITGPALDRLRMTFPSQRAYLDYWRAHPALAADWNDHIERCYAYDLGGAALELVSTVGEEAVLEDSARPGTSPTCWYRASTTTRSC